MLCFEKTVPRPISKKSKLSISLDQQFKALCFVFIVYQDKDYRNTLKLSCRPHAFTSYKALKKKGGLVLVSQHHFLHDSQRNYFPCYILSPDNVSLSGCLYFVRYRAIFVLQLFANQVVTSQILKLIHLSNQTVFSKTSRQRFKYLENKKSF